MMLAKSRQINVQINISDEHDSVEFVSLVDTSGGFLGLEPCAMK